MQRINKKVARSLTIGTAAAFGLGSIFVAPAAFASNDKAEAPVSGPAYTSQATSLLNADDSVQGVGTDADGNIVIYKLKSEASAAASTFDKTFSNVVIKDLAAPIEPAAAKDVVGGAGYNWDAPGQPGFVGFCSLGFAAWSPTGAPAFVSAGHCSADGAVGDLYLNVPSKDEAVSNSDQTFGRGAELGTFGFSQYGGPGHTPGGENTDSTDISVIDVENSALDLTPRVTDWTTGADDDLAASTSDIKSVGKAEAGDSIAKSGRTTGFTEGTVAVSNLYFQVGQGADARTVLGFASEDTEVFQGDSGGSVISGTEAVGVVSAVTNTKFGQEGYASFFTDLQNGLAKTDGYTVQLKLDAPVISTTGEVVRGTDISGKAPANSDVTITPATGDPIKLTANGAGNWSFKAPAKLGEFKFSVQAKSGFNTTPKTDGSVTVVAAPLTAPVIGSPADGSSVVTSVSSISGTGLPGAVVTLSGAVTGTATVTDAGNWSVPAELSYGKDYIVSATQKSEGETSPAATTVFNVIPVGPAITSPTDGQQFAHDAVPTVVTGTGIKGSTVEVKLNGTVLGASASVAADVAPDGTWSATLTGVATGVNIIEATQTINGATSAAAAASFAVAAAPTPTPTATPSPTPTTSEVPTNPEDPKGNHHDGLADTGVDLAPVGGFSALLIGLGAVALAFTKRRATRTN